jgi:hypothetical protein
VTGLAVPAWSGGWLRGELPLVPIAGTAVLFLIFGRGWLGDLASPLWLVLMFGWLFAVVLWAAIRVVRHAALRSLPSCSPRSHSGPSALPCRIACKGRSTI